MKKQVVAVVAAWIFVFWCGPALGASKTRIFIPEIKAPCGQAVVAPVHIGPVEKLAGIKMTLEYDPKALVFEKADKSKATASMMHVVNDKTPGRLIIVMAAAKGVGGADVEILTLRFKPVPCKGKTPVAAKIKFAAPELVSEDLKNIPCEPGEYPIRIEPAAKR